MKCPICQEENMGCYIVHQKGSNLLVVKCVCIPIELLAWIVERRDPKK